MQELSSYYLIETHYGPLHMHINYREDTGQPTKVFCNIPPIGTEINSLTHLVGILLSKYFEVGGEAQRILKHLQSIKSEHIHRYQGMEIESIPHAMSIALKSHLQNWKNVVPPPVHASSIDMEAIRKKIFEKIGEIQ